MLYVTPSTTQWSDAFLVIDKALHMNVTLPLILVGSLRTSVGIEFGFDVYREQSKIRDNNVCVVMHQLYNTDQMYKLLYSSVVIAW